MEVIKDIASAKAFCREKKIQGKRIGFVPTLGALHRGHLFLIRRARGECDFLVVSIFLNPTQFDSPEDLTAYPRTLSEDARLCQKQGVDMVFAPAQDDMYPEGFSTWVVVEGRFTRILEGSSRPEHFRGVSTVVAKLFNIVQPECSFFGEKDYQQALIIKKMVKELNMDTQIVLLPTVREKDGLACSSRNRYLNPDERKAATVLYKSLLRAKKMIEKGEKDSSRVIKSITELFNAQPLARIDYVAIVDPHDLGEVNEIKKEVLVVLAAWVGKARLIDNMLIKE